MAARHDAQVAPWPLRNAKREAILKLRDRTGEVWERVAGDLLDATWVVLGPPTEEGHPCGTFNNGTVGIRVETSVDEGTWDNSPFLRRLA